MDLYRSMSGIVSVKLVSADIPGCLRVMQQQEIVVWDVKPLSILTITFQIRFWDYRKLRQLMKRRGASMEMIGSLGMFWKILPILHRPILVLGISVILLLSLYLPSRVLFIRVEGNTTIPTQWILEQAQECGIRAGCHTRSVRS